MNFYYISSVLLKVRHFIRDKRTQLIYSPQRTAVPDLHLRRSTLSTASLIITTELDSLKTSKRTRGARKLTSTKLSFLPYTMRCIKIPVIVFLLSIDKNICCSNKRLH